MEGWSYFLSRTEEQWLGQWGFSWNFQRWMNLKVDLFNMNGFGRFSKDFEVKLELARRFPVLEWRDQRTLVLSQPGEFWWWKGSWKVITVSSGSESSQTKKFEKSCSSGGRQIGIREGPNCSEIVRCVWTLVRSGSLAEVPLERECASTRNEHCKNFRIYY